jgi:hypothetical protein
MTATAYSHRDPRRGARALLFASYAAILISISLNAQAQDQSQPQPPQQAPVESERWNLFYQATSIGQYHGTFHSPYSGPFSLQDYMERDVSLTTTLFFGLRLIGPHALDQEPAHYRSLACGGRHRHQLVGHMEETRHEEER